MVLLLPGHVHLYIDLHDGARMYQCLVDVDEVLHESFPVQCPSMVEKIQKVDIHPRLHQHLLHTEQLCSREMKYASREGKVGRLLVYLQHHMFPDI